MTLTILEVIKSGPVIQSLASQKLKGVASLRVRRIAERLFPEVRTAAIARDSLLTDENSIDIGGGLRRVKPEQVDEFLRSPLFLEEIELDLKPLTESDIAEAAISAEEIECLGPLFAGEKQE